MQNFTTIYNEKEKVNGTYNAWNYYFKSFNKYNLNEVYKSKNVIFSNNKYLKKNHLDRKSTRLNSSHVSESRMPSSA